jgi:Transposase DDE domain
LLTLLADRGLGCWQLAQLCHEAGWHYLFRLESGSAYQTSSGEWALLLPSAVQRGTLWSAQTLVGKEHRLATYLTITWQAEYQAPWFLLSDFLEGRQAVRHYARRMTIEAVFADWKKRGWFLTCTMVTRPERLERLLLVVSLAWWWLMHLGASCVAHGHRSLFDRPDRATKSLARIGFEWLWWCLERLSSPASIARLVPLWRKNSRLVFSLQLSLEHMCVRNKDPHPRPFSLYREKGEQAV